MPSSQYQRLVAIGRREGKSMSEIAEAWRQANIAVHRNPIAPERIERYARQVKVGRALSEGEPFTRALARARDSSSVRRNPYQAARSPSSSSSSSTRRNPSTNWAGLLWGAAALGVLWWYQRGSGTTAPPSASASGPNTTPPTVPGQVPPGTKLIPYSTWWVKWRNGGNPAPINSEWPDVMVWDMPDGGMVGLPIPPSTS